LEGDVLSSMADKSEIRTRSGTISQLGEVLGRKPGEPT
jgi:hypothetical protein